VAADSQCPACLAWFTPRKPGQEACSRDCANTLRSRRSAGARAAKLAGRRKPGSKTRYSKQGGRAKHRKLAEELLGRKLRPGEEVHHMDGDRSNDAPHNLIVTSSHGTHMRLGHKGQPRDTKGRFA
jgi:hypothetical protein